MLKQRPILRPVEAPYCPNLSWRAVLIVLPRPDQFGFGDVNLGHVSLFTPLLRVFFLFAFVVCCQDFPFAVEFCCC